MSTQSKAIHITAQDHTLGSPTATLELIEYGDYQCPSCGQAAPIVQRVVKHFGDRLRFAFRNFPLEQHEFAEMAAETAEFAAAQDEAKFWPMHDLLYKHQDDFAEDLFPKLAKQLGLDPAALEKALKDGTYTAKVEKEMQGGEKAGVPGTPAFFLNGKLYQGSFDYASLVEALEAAS